MSYFDWLLDKTDLDSVEEIIPEVTRVIEEAALQQDDPLTFEIVTVLVLLRGFIQKSAREQFTHPDEFQKALKKEGENLVSAVNYLFGGGLDTTASTFNN